VIAGSPLPTGPSQLFQQLGPGVAIPQVVVIDTAAGRNEALQLSSRLAAECPGMAVVLVSEHPDTFALAALRAGACDVVHPDAEVGELAAVLGRAAQIAASTAPQGPGDPAMSGNASTRGRVISVVSPKGGVGKTTVATNLAVGLARTAPLSTVIVDLDVQFGDVASALNLDPEHTLLDVVRGPAVQDSMVLKTFLTQHQTGLYAVCGPTSPADADDITAADVAQLLKTLASEFRYVVVDTAPGLDDHALAAIDQADELVTLTSLDVPGVRGLRKELNILRDLGLNLEKRHVVVNFADPRSGLTKPMSRPPSAPASTWSSPAARRSLCRSTRESPFCRATAAMRWPSNCASWSTGSPPPPCAPPRRPYWPPKVVGTDSAGSG